MSESKRICLGAFAGAHGVRGEVKVKTFTANPRDVAQYGTVESEDGKRTFTLKVVRILKGDFILISAPEISTREDAQSLAGTRFYVDRDKLGSIDDDEFFFADLVGLTVRLADGATVGKISAVHNFGAGDIIEIQNIPNQKGTHLVPFTQVAVPQINISEQHVVLNPDYLPGEDTAPDEERDEHNKGSEH